MNNVAVLMSTYNGEKYLKEQIESIFKQEKVNIKLYIRDDGSTDNTMAIINELKMVYDIVVINNSIENMGPAKSFMKLVYNVEDTFDFYAFSDQDDIWENNKIISAIDMIKKHDDNKPIIYGGNYKLLYDSNIVKENIMNIEMDFYSTLVRNKIAGCTMVFNRELLMRLKNYMPEFIEMHDIWVLEVCQAIGGICIYDKRAHIMYRQHDGNVAGAGKSIKSKIKARLKRKNVCSSTARELLVGYEELIDAEIKEVLIQLISYKKSFRMKIKLILNKKIKSEKLISTLFFKIGLLFNYE